MKNRKRKHNIIYVLKSFLLFVNGTVLFAQGSPDYHGGYKIKFNDEGSKYIRILTWAQVQGVYDLNTSTDDRGNENTPFNFKLRRARLLAFSQINKNFMLLTHFGLNSLQASNMSTTGKEEDSQLFLHGMWAQYNLNKNISAGAGLHYFNGISRLNNQSTINMLTLDNYRPSWSTIGLTDQFARHLGVFVKGTIFKKLQFRVAVNDALKNTLDVENLPEINNRATYNGVNLLGTKKAGKVYTGYFDYHFLEQESNFLPYKVGSYLGTKEIFNIGAGFFYHPNGSVVNVGTVSTPSYVGEDVLLFATDVFYDKPIGSSGAAITAYAMYQNNNYGKDYLFSAYGTGNMFYSHVGYLVKGDKTKTRVQPYISYGHHTYTAIEKERNTLGVGVNTFFSGHNSKLTLEYKKENWANTNTITLQAMIYL